MSKSRLDVLLSVKSEIQAQKEGQEKVRQLSFENIQIDGVLGEDIAKLILQFGELESLEFTNCGLEGIGSLTGLEKLKKLKLRNNKLKRDSLVAVANSLSNLEELDVRGNGFSGEDLAVLGKLNNLKKVNAGVDDAARKELFKQLEKVETVDGARRDGNDAEGEEDEEEEDDDDDEDEDEEDEDDEEDDEEDEEQEVNGSDEEEEEEEIEKRRKKRKV